MSSTVNWQWRIEEIHVDPALLQKALETGIVNVIPLHESSEGDVVWMVQEATYGLIISNTEWQVWFAQDISSLGLCINLTNQKFFTNVDESNLVNVTVMKMQIKISN